MSVDNLDRNIFLYVYMFMKLKQLVSIHSLIVFYWLGCVSVACVFTLLTRSASTPIVL